MLFSKSHIPQNLTLLQPQMFFLFPYRHPVNPTCPYQQVHDKVLNLMPLSDTPSASDPENSNFQSFSATNC